MSFASLPCRPGRGQWGTGDGLANLHRLNAGLHSRYGHAGCDFDDEVAVRVVLYCNDCDCECECDVRLSNKCPQCGSDDVSTFPVDPTEKE